MYIADGWKDYEVIDTGDGEKLERWGDVILRRPDPQAIWPCEDKSAWKQAHAWYHRSASGGGEWEFFRRLPEKWEIDYKNLRFCKGLLFTKVTCGFSSRSSSSSSFADSISS